MSFYDPELWWLTRVKSAVVLRRSERRKFAFLGQAKFLKEFKSLNNGILMAIVTSKESHFNANLNI